MPSFSSWIWRPFALKEGRLSNREHVPNCVPERTVFVPRTGVTKLFLGPNPILCIVLLSLGLGVRLNWMKLPFGMFGYQVELRRQILEVMDLAGHPF